MPREKVKSQMIRPVITFFFSFLMSLFLSILLLVIAVHISIFNPKSLQRSISKSDFVEYAQAEIEDYLVSYGLSSGFDEEFFVTVLEREVILNDSLIEAEYIYSPNISKDHISAFRDNLRSRLYENAAERNIAIDEEAEKGIQYLIDICAETYSDYISMPGFSSALSLLLGYKGVLIPVEIGLFVLILLCAFNVVRLYRNGNEYIRFLIYALGGTVITISMPVVVVIAMRFIDRIGISSRSLYSLFVNFAYNALYTVLIEAVIVLTVMAALGVARIMMLYRSSDTDEIQDLVVDETEVM